MGSFRIRRRAIRVAAVALTLCCLAGITMVSVGQIGLIPGDAVSGTSISTSPGAHVAASGKAASPADVQLQLPADAGAPATPGDPDGQAASAAYVIEVGGGEHVASQLMMQAADGIGTSELLEALARSGYEGARIDPSGEAFGYLLVTLGAEADEREALDALEKLPEVANIQFNHVYHLLDGSDGTIGGTTASAAGAYGQAAAGAGALAASGAPALAQQAANDPEADARTGRQRAALEMIRAHQAWELAQTNQAVTIAVLDSGCDLDHPDLCENVIAEAAYNALDGSSDVADVSSHGTHVAGIAAARAGNGIGVAGVSFNARILPVKVVQDDGRVTSFAALKGLDYVRHCAADHPEYAIRVINMSFGGKMSAPDGTDCAFIRAVDELSRAGILTVAAAGNTDASQGEVPPYRNWPGDFSCNIVNVINASSLDGRAGGSNYNRDDEPMAKCIAAPGTNILSTVPGGAHDAGSSDFGTKSGTSMASPCVAGIAALVFAANPDLSPSQVMGILYATATDMGPAGFDAETGFGMANAEEAVRSAQEGRSCAGSAALIAGDSLAIRPSGADAGNLTWESSDPDVASAGPDGAVEAKKAGYAIITALPDPADAGNPAAGFRTVVSAHSPIMSGADVLKEGSSSAWGVSGALPTVWTWSSSDSSVASVSDSGRVRGIAPGTAVISAALSSNPDARIWRTVTVLAATTSLARATVTLPAALPYSGSELSPAPEVAIDGIRLVPGRDYTRSYANNIAVGKATVTIVGKGDYSGTVVRTFDITGSIADASIGPIGPQTYTGKPLLPEPTISFAGRKLVRGTDFELAYARNVDTGTATVTVAGKGSYAGSSTATFRIQKAAQRLSVRVKSVSVKKSRSAARIARSRAFTLAGARTNARYAKVSGSKRLSINARTGAIAVKKGAPKGSYKIKVKATCAASKNYRAATKTFTVRVRVK